MLEFYELIGLFKLLAAFTYSHSHSLSLGRGPRVREGIPMQLNTHTSIEGFASTKLLPPKVRAPRYIGPSFSGRQSPASRPA